MKREGTEVCGHCGGWGGIQANPTPLDSQEAWLLCRTSSGVGLCWDLEEPQWPYSVGPVLLGLGLDVYAHGPTETTMV